MLGARIRALRLERGLSVRQLASEVEVSAATISQVERAINDPSLGTLRRIAKVLEVPLFELFAEEPNERLQVVRADQRLMVHSTDDGVEYWRASPMRGKIEMLDCVLRPGSESSEEGWSHPSEECVVVTKGKLVIEVGDERLELGVGDSTSFDSMLPHRYLNPGRSAARFLLAVTPPSF